MVPLILESSSLGTRFFTRGGGRVWARDYIGVVPTECNMLCYPRVTSRVVFQLIAILITHISIINYPHINYYTHKVSN